MPKPTPDLIAKMLKEVQARYSAGILQHKNKNIFYGSLIRAGLNGRRFWEHWEIQQAHLVQVEPLKDVISGQALAEGLTTLIPYKKPECWTGFYGLAYEVACRLNINYCEGYRIEGRVPVRAACNSTNGRYIDVAQEKGGPLKYPNFVVTLEIDAYELRELWQDVETAMQKNYRIWEGVTPIYLAQTCQEYQKHINFREIIPLMVE